MNDTALDSERQLLHESAAVASAGKRASKRVGESARRLMVRAEGEARELKAQGGQAEREAVTLDDCMLEAIQSLYEAAMDESKWPVVLAELADVTSGQSAVLCVLHSATAAGTTALCPSSVSASCHPAPRLVGQMSPAATVKASVAVHRLRGASCFEPRDIARFGVLRRHLERALAIAFRLGTLGAMQQAALDLLDRSPAAVFLLDERLRVVYKNRSAAELCAAGDGIRLAADELTVARKPDADQLRRLLAEARSIRRLPPLAPDLGTMRAARPSGRRPYAILVAPVTPRSSALAALSPAVSIVVSDPESDAPLAATQLRTAFGLTDAEARLAALLGGGRDLRSAAGKLGITYGTARARLVEIFDKTGTRRQGELIKLLLMTAGLS